MAEPQAKKAKIGPAVKFYYFPLWAKGPAPALALNFSGMEWEGPGDDFDWKTLKPKVPWRELPVLEVPDVGFVGHELAILNFIASQCPAMAGANVKEQVISSQLMAEAEDIYQKLVKVQPTILAKEDKIPREELAKVWTDTEQATHNRNYGVPVYFTLLEDYYKACAAGDGKFTSSGTTVGECKLFASLHTCKMIQDNIIDSFPGLKAFYTRFENLEKTKEILTTGGKMGKPFKQYFIAPP